MEGGVGVAVDANDFGGDALADLWLVAGLGQDDETRVCVEVDEAGAHDLVGRVDDAGGVQVRDIATQDGHRLALDADGGAETDVAGAVDYLAAADENVKHRVGKLTKQARSGAAED